MATIGPWRRARGRKRSESARAQARAQACAAWRNTGTLGSEVGAGESRDTCRSTVISWSGRCPMLPCFSGIRGSARTSARRRWRPVPVVDDRLCPECRDVLGISVSAKERQRSRPRSALHGGYFRQRAGNDRVQNPACSTVSMATSVGRTCCPDAPQSVSDDSMPDRTPDPWHRPWRVESPQPPTNRVLPCPSSTTSSWAPGPLAQRSPHVFY